MKKISDKIIKKSIANKAAEIIFEEGVSDYLFAKKKAAKADPVKGQLPLKLKD